MSEIKVNKISPRTNCGTVTLGDSGDSFVVPAGATITNNGTQTGFGRTGTVDWETTPKTATFTAVSGKGYFCNTAGGTFEVDLPAGTAGDIISLQDYNNTFDTAKITIDPNGSEKINGGTAGGWISLNSEGEGVTLVYVDSTVGWRTIHQSTFADTGSTPTFVTATGGTITTCGDYKIHTFTGPGTFTVCSVGNPAGSTTVDYMVVAGGAAGGTGRGTTYSSGGGGAGGMRYCFPNPSTGGKAVSASPGSYPVTVGAGGAVPGSDDLKGNAGSASCIFSTPAAGGGGGASGPGSQSADTGGSGGGGGNTNNPGGAAGNTPPVSPPQGNAGGNSSTPTPAGKNSGAGGGGHGGVGENNAPYPDQCGSSGGAGTPLTIGASPSLPGGRAYAGGGAGSQAPTCRDTGVPGGGGAGRPNASSARCGIANTGGGGSGGFPPCYGAGGSGVVVIRYKYQ